ncbi:hypothetical protein Ddye_010497 [Dipteronia dyeriana]|uniref:Pentatricopeptide repeat-containing protein n=1 Tax=Dipteronia dyeriana TaxID=168575 RepID=A0AAE0CN76_9ROSI|nr:hypothetical protein Ddye_010497 [Dipteronia dyeriana]
MKWRPMAAILHRTELKLLSPPKLNHLLQLCSNSNCLNQGKIVHQQIIVYGHNYNPFMITKLVQMYTDCDDLVSASNLFDRMPQPNVFAWTSFLKFHARHEMHNQCVKAYNEMKRTGVLPDNYVFPKVLKACAQLLNFKAGILVHKDVIVCGYECNLQVCNSLVDMYAKCMDVKSARRVFDEMVDRDLWTWNSMISGYVSNGLLDLAVEMLNSMTLNGFEPDVVTWNTVMDAYCRMGLCDEAWKIFEHIKEPSIISWTILISGYSRIGKQEVSLRIFRDMMNCGASADSNSLSSVLVSCRHLGALMCGKEIHSYGVKTESGIGFYSSAGPALLTMYAKHGRIQDARNVFELMDKCDVVSWNAMFVGLIDLGLRHFALEYFRNMQRMGIKVDQTTLSVVLPACDLKSGKEIHSFVTKSSFGFVVPVCNALIHMYSKCGCITSASSVFSNMFTKDIVSWNTMIGGFAMHGLGHDALTLLQEMNRSGIIPDSVTFTSALAACSHSGLIDEGLALFNSMSRDSGFAIRMEHFSCVVDMLARAGRLEEAVEFICGMPGEPDKHIWGALLTASLAHQNVDLGKLASEQLITLEPENAGHYVTLSNMYAGAGRWDDAVNVRKQMESKGLVKLSGQSWIENEN